jgi:23S rRNA pseudouridine2605 synthase
VSAATEERLNQFLARRGVTSRRGADDLIAAGRVTVNGAPGVLGLHVDPARDTVAVDGQSVAAAPRVPVTFVLNKPAGVVTTKHDPQHRPTVMELVAPTPALVPVGRLDADSRGLLLLTTDGELAHRVSHPRFALHKTYRITVDGVASDQLLAGLVAGVHLEDGFAKPVEVRRSAHGGTIEVVMAEGRRREVRRLFEAVGLTVVDLLRTRIGPISLSRLPEGASRRLTSREDLALRSAVGLPAAP